MVHVSRLVALFAIPVLFSGAAAAQTVDEVLTARFEGRFLEAADLAEGLGTSEGYALGAQALAIYGHHLAATREEAQATLLRAIDLAEKAVELDDSSPLAHQELAHAMGRYAETLPTTEALSGGYAEKTIASMRRGLELDPDFVYGHLAVAGWHARIINAAGFLGALIYGASEDEAIAHYQRATELGPDNVIVMAGHAIGLLMLDDDDYRGQVEELLTRIEAAPKEDAYERLMHEEVLKHLEAIDGS